MRARQKPSRSKVAEPLCNIIPRRSRTFKVQESKTERNGLARSPIKSLRASTAFESFQLREHLVSFLLKPTREFLGGASRFAFALGAFGLAIGACGFNLGPLGLKLGAFGGGEKALTGRDVDQPQDPTLARQANPQQIA